MTERITDLFGFAPVEGRAAVASFDGGPVTSDAGALLLGATDRAIGLVEGFSSGFQDARCPEPIEHEVETLRGRRVFAIAPGYEDPNDHDVLRRDPAMAVLADRRAHDCPVQAARRLETAAELNPPGPSLIVLADSKTAHERLRRFAGFEAAQQVLGIARYADRVARERFGSHVGLGLAHRCEHVCLRFDAVALRNLVVDRDTRAVIDRPERCNARIAQALVRVEQIAEARISEGDVVETGAHRLTSPY